MVKNAGGNKAKGQARKHASGSNSKYVTTRISEDVSEVYAQVTAILGNGMCHVLCIDNETRLCHIRGKFRGRNKRDNTLEKGTWILVGLREWEQEKIDKKSANTKMENCDLLMVYTDNDKDNLKKIKTTKWNKFIKNDNDLNNTNEEVEEYDDEEDDLGFVFNSDTSNDEYKALIEAQVKISGSAGVKMTIDEEEVNADDI